MPTITAQSILNKTKTLLQDTTNIRWSDAELLGWLNDGQREVCMIRPDACTKLQSVPLVSGTKQAIPSDGTAVIKVIRNMGASGTTPGAAVRKVPMELLDSSTPNWHAASQVAVIQHFMTDARMPRNFYVYPPANGTSQVELLYAAPPLEVPFQTATGTYTQSGNTVTITQAAHGLSVNSWVQFVPTAGAGVPGFFQVQTVPGTGSYTLTSPVSQTVSSSACTINGVISVDDTYSNPLIDYTAYRAYMKDNDLIGNDPRAQGHRKLFLEYMQSRTQVDGAVTASKDNVAG